jgi:hypothetical protein
MRIYFSMCAVFAAPLIASCGKTSNSQMVNFSAAEDPSEGDNSVVLTEEEVLRLGLKRRECVVDILPSTQTQSADGQLEISYRFPEFYFGDRVRVIKLPENRNVFGDGELPTSSASKSYEAGEA